MVPYPTTREESGCIWPVVSVAYITYFLEGTHYELGIEEYKHVLANILHSRYVAIAMQPVHRLQIRLIVHNWGASPTTLPSYTRVHAIL